MKAIYGEVREVIITNLLLYNTNSTPFTFILPYFTFGALRVIPL